MLQPGDQAPVFSARPIFGSLLTVPESLSEGPLVLCFVAGLASPFTRRSLALLQERFADLDRRGVRVVAVSHTSLESAQDYVPRHHLLFPLIADPEGVISAQYGVQRDPTLLRSLPHLLWTGRGVLREALGHGVGWTAGAVRQCTASFLLDRKAVVRYACYAQSIGEPPPIEALLLCTVSAS